MKYGVFVFGLFFLLSAGSVLAAGPPGPLERALYPVELLMLHQREINLTDTQRESIKKEMDRAQDRFRDIEWALKAEVEVMVGILAQDPVNEPEALAQLDKVSVLETRLKKEHLSLLVRVKNLLTPEQKAKLDEIKRSFARSGPPGGPPTGPPGRPSMP